mmetsp:Transcript_87577/g.165057  ORF Transcript_87577/g.165057 Transcript_87577/m.165057 type:complete len:375 (-) Transcript_87577:66-1190(-)
MAKQFLHIVYLIAQALPALGTPGVKITFYSDTDPTCIGTPEAIQTFPFGCTSMAIHDMYLSCLDGLITAVKYGSTNGLCTGPSLSTTAKGEGVCGPALDGIRYEKFSDTMGCDSTGGYAAGNDPIARFGNRTVAFELPAHELVTLLSTPGSVIRGSVFEGHGPWEQWFNRLVITTPADDRFLEIKMKDNLLERNYTRVPRNIFKTLDVTLGIGPYAQPLGTSKIDSYHTRIPESLLGFQVAFRPMKRNFHHIQSVGRFPRECVDLAGIDVHFYVCSSLATEYYGNLDHLAVKFAHLDMAFVESHLTSLTGLLPELWGVQPMSEASKRFVKEEKTEVSASNASNVSQTAAAGGLSAEHLMQDCSFSDELDLTSIV